MIEFLLVFLVIFFLPVYIVYRAFSRIRKLENELHNLRKDVRQLVLNQPVKKQEESSYQSYKEPDTQPEFTELTQPDTEPAVTPERESALAKTTPEETVTLEVYSDSDKQPEAEFPPYIQTIIKHFKKHWLVWVGALALIVGVTYLLQVISNYIEFTPLMRISAAFIGSCIVVALGEKFHQREKSYAHIGFAYVPAAITGAGMTGLYSTIIFSYLIYSFLPPVISLLLMGAVSVISLSLFLRMGPLMAILGLFGGFSAPLWFDSNLTHHFGLAGYINFIAFAGMLLASHVRRNWLYPLTLIPYFCWSYFIAYDIPASEMLPWSLVYVSAAIYLLLGVPLLGWKLSTNYNHCVNHKTYNLPVAATVITLLILESVHKTYLADSIGYAIGFLYALFITWLPALYKNQHHGRYLTYTVTGAIIAATTALKLPSADMAEWFIVYSGAITFSLIMFRGFLQLTCRPRDQYLSWFTPALPVALCLTGWLMMKHFFPGYLYFWLAYVFMVSICFGYYASRLNPITDRVYAFIHVNIAVALWFLFSGNELTIAMILQVALYVWHVNKDKFVPSDWALKLIVSAGIIRITVATLIPSLQTGTVSMSGNLLVYLFTLCVFIYSYFLLRESKPVLAQWIEGGFVHLFAVMVFDQTQHWIDQSSHTILGEEFAVISLYACQSLVLCLIYRKRLKYSGSLKRFYDLYSKALFFASALLVVLLNTNYLPLLRPTLNHTDMLLFNWMSVGWLVPAAILFYMAKKASLKEIVPPKILAITASVLITLWAIMTIRQIWQPGTLVLNNPTGMGEQFTYSVTGLITGAIATMVGIFRKENQVVRLGLGILIAVIIKVFIFDISLLSGFWRAASFIGLGASLVGLGWLFQRISANRQQTNTS